MKDINVKRYIPTQINNFLKRRIHIHIKWNKDLSSEIVTLDYEGLVIACDTILRVSGTRNTDKNNMCEIQYDLFHKILHNNYRLYLDYLIENKIVITDGIWIYKEKSFSYKLNDDFVDNLESIDINDKLFKKRTIKELLLNTKKLNITTKHKNNYYKSFKIDFQKAIQYLDYIYINEIPDHKGRVLTKYTRTLLEHKLLQINDGQLWMNRSKSNGRINSNLTTLNSDFKQFIYGYSFSLDVVSSQPCLVNLLFNIINALSGEREDISSSNLSYITSYVCKILSNNLEPSKFKGFLAHLKITKLPNKKEMEIYKNLCESGQLYEFIMNEIYKKTGTKMTRNQVKEIIMIVFYSPNTSGSEYKKLFQSIFPSIYSFLCKLKSFKVKRQHRLLPIMLQAIESFIWVENILPKLDKMSIKYCFIHDSVLVDEIDIERAYLVIDEQFTLLKVNPKIKIENLKIKN